MSKKFYIGTGLANRDQHNVVRDFLVGLGHEITYDWTVEEDDFSKGKEPLAAIAQKEVDGIKAADYVVILWPGGRGMHVEMGVAISELKDVHFVTPIESHHDCAPGTSAFYYLPNVIMYKRVAQFMEACERVWRQ